MTAFSEMIDHTCLKAITQEADIEKLCEEALKYQFKTVCVPLCYVSMAAYLLKESSVGITTVVGFPLGHQTTAIKVYEAQEAVKDGATDIDMVINIGALKDNKYDYVKYEIQEIVRVVKQIEPKTIVKVIIETCYLDEEELLQVAQIIVEAGADFIKTSTGFGTSGATLENIECIKKNVGNQINIKASGGISDLNFAKALLKAGADRIGTSRSVEMMKQLHLTNN